MIRGEIIYIGSPTALAKNTGNATKAALMATGRFWHRVILPAHFEPQAKHTYQYQQRDEAYQKRKLARVGHNIDLLFSGESKRDLTARRQLSGTSKLVRISLSAPKHFYQYRGRGPHKAEEVLRTADADREAMGKVLGEAHEAHLNAVQDIERDTF